MPHASNLHLTEETHDNPCLVSLYKGKYPQKKMIFKNKTSFRHENEKNQILGEHTTSYKSSTKLESGRTTL